MSTLSLSLSVSLALPVSLSFFLSHLQHALFWFWFLHVSVFRPSVKVSPISGRVLLSTCSNS